MQSLLLDTLIELLDAHLLDVLTWWNSRCFFPQKCVETCVCDRSYLLTLIVTECAQNNLFNIIPPGRCNMQRRNAVINCEAMTLFQIAYSTCYTRQRAGAKSRCNPEYLSWSLFWKGSRSKLTETSCQAVKALLAFPCDHMNTGHRTNTHCSKRYLSHSQFWDHRRVQVPINY